MDLQTRKISFVREFLNIENEQIVIRLEKYLKKEKKNNVDLQLHPITDVVLNQRIDKSIEDSSNQKLTDADDFLAEIEKWN
jgi:hypothetical protein